jgi:hypothetical protein
LIVLGIKYGPQKQKDGAQAKEEAVNPAMELIDRFINEYHTTNCCELTGFDFRDPVQFQTFKDSPEARQKCTEKMSRVCGWIAEIISRRDNKTSS